MPLQQQELSVRTQDVGGSVSFQVIASPTNFGYGKRRLVLLVHGYNVNLQAARQSYNGFIEKLKKLGGKTLEDDIGKLYWPGDVNLGALSVASYPLEMTPAIQSGGSFANYIHPMFGPEGTPIQIYLVAHSLGNRMSLELYSHYMLLPRGLVQFSGTTLMAAAVQVNMVENGNRLHQAAVFARTLTLFSRNDWVLGWPFRAGQTLALEGLFPTAVGRVGQPTTLWSECHEMTGNGHSDYWSDERCARRVARFLGIPVEVDIEPSYLSVHQLPPQRPIPDNVVEDRPLPPHQI